MTAVAVRPRAWLPSPMLLGVIAAAWAIAIMAEFTGRVQWAHHHQLQVADLTLWASLGLFFIAWQIHIAAMMLPSSLPMISLFRRASATQPRPATVRAAFLGGYLLVWMGFGFAALLGDSLLHYAMHQWHWLLHRPELIAGGVLMLAGVFQFTDLKDRCLDKCRHPAAFLMSYYQRGASAALKLGARHGLFCLGCCWALMLVMFVVGIANLAWMVPLALLMLYEKIGPGGDRAARPVGVVLFAFGALVAASPGWMPSLIPGH